MKSGDKKTIVPGGGSSRVVEQSLSKKKTSVNETGELNYCSYVCHCNDSTQSPKK